MFFSIFLCTGVGDAVHVILVLRSGAERGRLDLEFKFLTFLSWWERGGGEGKGLARVHGGVT